MVTVDCTIIDERSSTMMMMIIQLLSHCVALLKLHEVQTSSDELNVPTLILKMGLHHALNIHSIDIPSLLRIVLNTTSILLEPATVMK